MQRQILILTIVALTSCGQSEKTNKNLDSKAPQETASKKDNKFENALKFINGHVENSNKMKDAVGIIDWVNSKALTTKDFNDEMKAIIDDAYTKDPELGLEADPIFDAQDYPIKGFELESFDEKTNYLIVKGIDWAEYKLTMKIKEENGNWLVDGCGIINIPKDKRAER